MTTTTIDSLRDLRESKGMKAFEVAAKMPYVNGQPRTAESVLNIERRGKITNVYTLRALAEIYDVSISEIERLAGNHQG